MENKCIGVVEGQVFFEGMDCVLMVLNCALEVGFLGVWGGMVVSVMLVGGFTIFFRCRRVYFSQDYMCRVLKNFGDCGICTVSERSWSYFAAMKLCGESGKGGCNFGNFFKKCRCVGVFSLWVFQALGVVETASRSGVEVIGPGLMKWANLSAGAMSYCL